MKDWLIPVLLGFGTGILSAWGIGGGTLLLLIMTLFLGIDQRTAQGINLLYFLPAALFSLRSHAKCGYLDRGILRAAIPLGTACAAIAAYIAGRIDLFVLRKPFGIFLLYAAFSILFKKESSE